ncbi:DNA polymerase beta domain protein region [Methanocaldococcus infernus ME]|uniref:protein adenylyltransferase n=1 Tax=Methanocaldococcus infernus (strain DSM 11812 / JCM 15783 / ME) TaxID=573063 RepID=D5VTA5_METIM|nr:nucleotidyltransferase domain-containing protein [Methanocaldococcus infernus]ADG13808.1 DNA polymerase beta domain protein region [Methanocaldococcus infernus ME]
MSINREEIKKKIKKILDKKDEVVFAYIYGSFNETSFFRDIDIGVYVDENKVKDFLEYELKLSTEIERVIGFPIDVKVLNSTPLRFKYRIIKGEPLISRDEDVRLKFVEKVLMEYLDFKPIEEKIIEEILQQD